MRAFSLGNRSLGNRSLGRAVVVLVTFSTDDAFSIAIDSIFRVQEGENSFRAGLRMVYSSHVVGSLCSIEHSELPRPDDRGTGMSTSHFFFLQDLCILELVEETRGILLSLTGCSKPCTQVQTKQTNVPAVASFRGYTDGFIPLAAVPPPQQWIAATSTATYYAAALHLEPGHSLLYCGSVTIYRQRYHISATLQACLE
jgi:hypothetical protein